MLSYQFAEITWLYDFSFLLPCNQKFYASQLLQHYDGYNLCYHFKIIWNLSIADISATFCYDFYFCIKFYNDFRLILIAEKDKVYEEFPTPLINRLEKHFVVTSTVLDNAQKELLAELETWARGYACIRSVSISLCNLDIHQLY